MQNYKRIIDGSTVNYYEWGDINKGTIVCFHGLAGNGFFSFAEIAVLLENDFHLIIFDSPGHGETATFYKESDYMFSKLAKWYQRVIQQVVPGPFYVMGHSWGADLALHYTKHYPDTVLGIILLDGGFTFPHNQKEMTFDHAFNGWNDYMNQAVFSDWASVVQEYQTYTNKWDTNKEHYVSSIFKKTDERFELIVSKFTVLSIIKAFFKEPFSDTYPYIKVPLLLIHPSKPENLDEARAIGISQLKDDLDDVTVIAMEGTGHMVQWDEPDRTVIEIKRWIEVK
ncbi:alpha/beta fold hydrolase [Psychrobacillus sp. NPDC096426]|uniref:alpha/beta fold hydrolase n=1 Tax=Psychrobacillus sp. NPDC096426 TaxID=3364491 RepID=UPI0038029044